MKDFDLCLDCVAYSVCADNMVYKCLACQNFHRALESKLHSHNNSSTPCRFFRRELIRTGENLYHSVPWCDHEPSQRAIP